MSPTSYRTAPPRVSNKEVYAPPANMSNASPRYFLILSPPHLIGEPVALWRPPSVSRHGRADIPNRAQ